MTAGQPVDPFPPLEEALRQLIEALDRNAALPPETVSEDPDVVNPDSEHSFANERARIMVDVAAVAGFMEAVRGLKGRERRLVTLLSHLEDVHEGRKSKLLSPDRKRRHWASTGIARPATR